MAEGGEDIDLVEDIIITPFSRLTFQEKLDIVRRGRPTPTLQSLSQAGKGFVRHFQSSNYERYQWLTGSEKHCKLYCWECLLLQLSERGAGSVKSTMTQSASQVHPAHAEAQHKETLAHTTNNSTAIFWTTFFARYETGFKTTKNVCFSPSWTPSTFRPTGKKSHKQPSAA